MVDLGHVLRTEVRGYRFDLAMPMAPPEIEPEGWRDSFLKTLSEAIRLAAARILAIDARDIRATVEHRAERPEVILYDAVAGGAGFVRRLHEEATGAKLIETAMEILSCPRDCASSCRGCLQDYSNQQSWDVLRRQPVRAWLDALRRDLAVENSQGRIWETPSLGTLREMMQGGSRLVLCARRLWTQGAESSVDTDDEGALSRRPDGLELLRGFLAGDAARRAVLVIGDVSPLAVHHLSRAAVLALKELALMIEDGRLEVRHGSLPGGNVRMVIDPDRPTGWLIHTDQLDIALFETLLPGVVRRLKLGAGTERHDLAAAIEKLPRSKSLLGWSAAETRVTAYRPAERRRIAEDFRDLISAKLDSVKIHDPYTLAVTTVGDNVELLTELLAQLVRIAQQPIAKVIVETRSARLGDPVDRRDWKSRQAALDESLRRREQPPCTARVVELRDREFHDRWIDITLTRPGGQSEIHRYYLSGGVDRYMDPMREAVLVHVQQSVSKPLSAATTVVPPMARPRGR